MKAAKIIYFCAGAIIGALAILLFQHSELLHSRAVPSEYLRLHWHGGWATDGDIWIYPDDRYRIRHYDSISGAITKERTGRREGLFGEIVAVADSRQAWQISTSSLKTEIAQIVALNPEKGGYSVCDANHAFLELRLGDRTLVADFYAAAAFAEFFPDAKQLQTFAALEAAFYRLTRNE